MANAARLLGQKYTPQLPIREVGVKTFNADEQLWDVIARAEAALLQCHVLLLGSRMMSIMQEFNDYVSKRAREVAMAAHNCTGLKNIFEVLHDIILCRTIYVLIKLKTGK